MVSPFYVLAAILLLQSKGAHGLPWGAGGCDGGKAAVGRTHFFNVPVVTASLSDGNLEVLFDGVPMDPAVPVNFTTAEEHEITLTGAVFRGVLFRLEAPLGVDISDALSEDDPNLHDAKVCNAPVFGITHTFNEQKSSASVVIFLDEAVTDLRLDLTVVISNSFENGSTYYYNGFVLNAVESVLPSTLETTSMQETSTPILPPATMQDPGTQPRMTLLMAMAKLDMFSIFLQLVRLADMRREMLGANVTVLAPTDEAFSSVGEYVSILLEEGNEEMLADFLRYHIVETIFPSVPIKNGQHLPTRQGGTVVVSATASSNAEPQLDSFQVFFNNNLLLTPGGLSKDGSYFIPRGIVHALGGVLVPPSDCGSDIEVSLRLWDADNDTPIGPLASRDEIKLSELNDAQLSIEAVISAPMCVDKIRFKLTDADDEISESVKHKQAETKARFMLGGDRITDASVVPPVYDVFAVPALSVPGSYKLVVSAVPKGRSTFYFRIME